MKPKVGDRVNVKGFRQSGILIEILPQAEAYDGIYTPARVRMPRWQQADRPVLTVRLENCTVVEKRPK